MWWLFVTKIEKKINEILDTIRPYLIDDGGDVEFVNFKDGIVYIRLLGACSNCGLIDVTLKEGIEDALVNEIPEVVGVEKVD